MFRKAATTDADLHKIATSDREEMARVLANRKVFGAPGLVKAAAEDYSKTVIDWVNNNPTAKGISDHLQKGVGQVAGDQIVGQAKEWFKAPENQQTIGRGWDALRYGGYGLAAGGLTGLAAGLLGRKRKSKAIGDGLMGAALGGLAGVAAGGLGAGELFRGAPETPETPVDTRTGDPYDSAQHRTTSSGLGGDEPYVYGDPKSPFAEKFETPAFKKTIEAYRRIAGDNPNGSDFFRQRPEMYNQVAKTLPKQFMALQKVYNSLPAGHEARDQLGERIQSFTGALNKTVLPDGRIADLGDDANIQGLNKEHEALTDRYFGAVRSLKELTGTQVPLDKARGWYYGVSGNPEVEKTYKKSMEVVAPREQASLYNQIRNLRQVLADPKTLDHQKPSLQNDLKHAESVYGTGQGVSVDPHHLHNQAVQDVYRRFHYPQWFSPEVEAITKDDGLGAWGSTRTDNDDFWKKTKNLPNDVRDLVANQNVKGLARGLFSPMTPLHDMATAAGRATGMTDPRSKILSTPRFIRQGYSDDKPYLLQENDVPKYKFDTPAAAPVKIAPGPVAPDPTNYKDLLERYKFDTGKYKVTGDHVSQYMKQQGWAPDPATGKLVHKAPATAPDVAIQRRITLDKLIDVARANHQNPNDEVVGMASRDFLQGPFSRQDERIGGMQQQLRDAIAGSRHRSLPTLSSAYRNLSPDEIKHLQSIESQLEALGAEVPRPDSAWESRHYWPNR